MLFLPPGVYGLLGPNGAGKSTLMNIITDNLNADSGEVLYNGENIKKLGMDYRGYFGCAFFMQFFLISGKIARLQHFGGMPISGFLIKIKNGGFHKVSI